MVLMIALLECSRPANEYLDATDNGGVVRVFAQMGFQAAVSALLLICAVLLLIPIHLFRAAIWHPLRVALAR
jgi:hypothetical protein